MLFLSKKIYVDDSPIHGRGVFASELILKDEVIEECHFVKLVINRLILQIGTMELQCIL